MGNKVIASKLKQAIKDNSIVSVYSDNSDPEHFSVGFIEAISGDYLLMQSMGKHGLYDGYIIRKLNHVFRIDTNGDYEKRLHSLYNIQNQKHSKLLQKNIEKNENLLVEMLKRAMSLKYIVSICLSSSVSEGEDFFGWIKNVSDTDIEVFKLSYYGHDDGETIIKVDDIQAVDCDTDDEIALRLLYNNEQKIYGSES